MHHKYWLTEVYHQLLAGILIVGRGPCSSWHQWSVRQITLERYDLKSENIDYQLRCACLAFEWISNRLVATLLLAIFFLSFTTNRKRSCNRTFKSHLSFQVCKDSARVPDCSRNCVLVKLIVSNKYTQKINLMLFFGRNFGEHQQLPLGSTSTCNLH